MKFKGGSADEESICSTISVEFCIHAYTMGRIFVVLQPHCKGTSFCYLAPVLQ
jgi:hypothetical protein